MTTEKNTVTVGLTNWGSKPERAPKKFEKRPEDELPKIPYAKLVEGSNFFRIVAGPAKYWQARVKLKGAKSKHGDKLRTAWPTYEGCPIKEQLGLEPRERYLVVAINRATNKLEMLDLSSLSYETISSNMATKNKRLPADKQVTISDYDISYDFNPKSDTPAGFYQVVFCDKEPLTEEDRKVIDSIGAEVIEKVLQRACLCPKPETVIKRLEERGWKPGDKIQVSTEPEEATNASTLSEASEDDYSFKRSDEDTAEAS